MVTIESRQWKIEVGVSAFEKQLGLLEKGNQVSSWLTRALLHDMTYMKYTNGGPSPPTRQGEDTYLWQQELAGNEKIRLIDILVVQSKAWALIHIDISWAPTRS